MASAATKQGDVLTMLSTLLDAGQLDAVLELVRKLVERNAELERRLAQRGFNARSSPAACVRAKSCAHPSVIAWSSVA